MDEMASLLEHSPTWPGLDFDPLGYENLVIDAYDLLHTAPPDLDRAAASQSQGASGRIIPSHIDNSQCSLPRDIAHDVPSSSGGDRPFSELSVVELFVPAAEDQQSTPASNDDSTFSKLSSPEIISTCTSSIQTPPDLDKSLQIVQYNHVKVQTKVFRPRKPPAKPRVREKKSRGLATRTDALKTDVVRYLRRLVKYSRQN
jgi:hypothetical protein